jgi:hypothetical protein
MKRSVKAQIAVLAGVFGFFIGGLVNAGREIMDIMVGAAIGWGIAFFIAFIALEVLRPSAGEENTPVINGNRASPMKEPGSIKKGMKIDFIARDNPDFDDIYNLKK